MLWWCGGGGGGGLTRDGGTHECPSKQGQQYGLEQVGEQRVWLDGHCRAGGAQQPAQQERHCEDAQEV